MGRFTAKNRGNYQFKIGSMRWNSLHNLGWYNCIIDPKNEKSIIKGSNLKNTKNFETNITGLIPLGSRVVIAGGGCRDKLPLAIKYSHTACALVASDNQVHYQGAYCDTDNFFVCSRVKV